MTCHGDHAKGTEVLARVKLRANTSVPLALQNIIKFPRHYFINKIKLLQSYDKKEYIQLFHSFVNKT